MYTENSQNTTLAAKNVDLPSEEEMDHAWGVLRTGYFSNGNKHKPDAMSLNAYNLHADT